MPAEQNIALIREFLNALSGKPKPAAVMHQYIAESDEVLHATSSTTKPPSRASN